MKRKEEIEKATMQVVGIHPDWDVLECFRVGYKEGAKWADETMIDKVEKYLRAKIILYTLATTVDQREEWFNDFRKAMEE